MGKIKEGFKKVIKLLINDYLWLHIIGFLAVINLGIMMFTKDETNVFDILKYNSFATDAMVMFVGIIIYNKLNKLENKLDRK